MKEYYLMAKYDARDSFYNKARVEEDDNGNSKLYSYNTHVATVKDGVAIVHGTFSMTTGRHIKEFLKQQGFRADDRKQIENEYMED